MEQALSLTQTLTVLMQNSRPSRAERESPRHRPRRSAASASDEFAPCSATSAHLGWRSGIAAQDIRSEHGQLSVGAVKRGTKGSGHMISMANSVHSSLLLAGRNSLVAVDFP